MLRFHELLPSPYKEYIENFEWVHGETPLTSYTWPITACIAYVVILILCVLFFKNRNPLRIKPIIAVHNLGLCIFSLVFVFAQGLEIIKQFKDNGFEGLFCDSGRNWVNGPFYFYIYIFYASKYYELLDSVFLAVTKKDLIFLHVYHHPATLVLCYFSADTYLTPQWICSFANGSVHTIMYFYYFLATVGQRPWWRKYVTKIQIFQFFVDIGLNSVMGYYLLTGHKCTAGWGPFSMGQFILISYLLLFIVFYRKNYGHGNSTTKTTTSTSTTSTKNQPKTRAKKD
eukprot:TRINITY_DN828_c0_g2_i3.p1 TRINITY_DN828_c0_g2~~TRINITY_DN828_c0_g2_i3.p1  ORF type:complete len:285 (+),score=85.09 TRINITY_DN828_c0_g2_i3:138-992(+)